MTHGGRR
jgi:hypothetical protein